MLKNDTSYTFGKKTFVFSIVLLLFIAQLSVPILDFFEPQDIVLLEIDKETDQENEKEEIEIEQEKIVSHIAVYTPKKNALVSIHHMSFHRNSYFDITIEISLPPPEFTL